MLVQKTVKVARPDRLTARVHVLERVAILSVLLRISASKGYVA